MNAYRISGPEIDIIIGDWTRSGDKRTLRDLCARVLDASGHEKRCETCSHWHPSATNPDLGGCESQFLRVSDAGRVLSMIATRPSHCCGDGWAPALTTRRLELAQPDQSPEDMAKTLLEVAIVDVLRAMRQTEYRTTWGSDEEGGNLVFVTINPDTSHAAKKLLAEAGLLADSEGDPSDPAGPLGADSSVSAPDATHWGYGPIDAEWYNKADSRDDAIAKGKAEYGPNAFEVASGRFRAVREFVDVQGILENMTEKAGDEYGEVAERWRPDNVPDSAKDELFAMMSGWVSKHCPVNFWVAETREEIGPAPDESPVEP